MPEYQRLQQIRTKKDLYDALVAKDVRETKQNDILNIATNGSTNVGAGSVICSATNDANHEAFLTAVYAASDTVGDVAAVVVNGSTIMPFRTNSSTQSPFTQRYWSYFARVPASQTIELIAVNAGSWVAFLCLNREPTHAKIEPAMYE